MKQEQLYFKGKDQFLSSAVSVFPVWHMVGYCLSAPAEAGHGLQKRERNGAIRGLFAMV